jgi:uncharacterized NAD-dependent epimerase/dehydratase family protein
MNTGKLPEGEALDLVAGVERKLGLPTVDPLRQGAERLVNALS